MKDYIFKTYIADGREYFVYGEREISGDILTTRSFPFPESLMRMLYLDIWKYEPLTKKVDRDLRALFETREERWAQEILTALDELAEAHIYFELLRLDWKQRLEQARRQGYADCIDLLPHKQITHTPSNIDEMQRQIKGLIAAVLDVDGERKPIPEKMVAYHDATEEESLSAFRFQPLLVGCEVIDHKVLAEVLYPKNIYDLIDFAVRECISREMRMRVCKNCGHWFAITGRVSAEYCELTVDEKGRTCKEIGAMLRWTKSKSGDDVFKEYRREYKRRFAWIKAGRIEQGEFYTWSAIAREKKAECESGKITLEEFSQWLDR